MFINGFTRVLISHVLYARPTWSALSCAMKSRNSVLLSKCRVIIARCGHMFEKFYPSSIYCVFVAKEAKIDNVKEKENLSKNERNLRLLQLFGNTAKLNKKNITFLSNYKLSPTEEFVLSHGLNFCLHLPTPSEKKFLQSLES